MSSTQHNHEPPRTGLRARLVSRSVALRRLEATHSAGGRPSSALGLVHSSRSGEHLAAGPAVPVQSCTPNEGMVNTSSKCSN